MKAKLISKQMIIAGMVLASIAFVLAFNGGFGSLGLSQAMSKAPYTQEIEIVSVIYKIIFIVGTLALPVGFGFCFAGKAKLNHIEKSTTKEIVYLA